MVKSAIHQRGIPLFYHSVAKEAITLSVSPHWGSIFDIHLKIFGSYTNDEWVKARDKALRVLVHAASVSKPLRNHVHLSKPPALDEVYHWLNDHRQKACMDPVSAAHAVHEMTVAFISVMKAHKSFAVESEVTSAVTELTWRYDAIASHHTRSSGLPARSKSSLNEGGGSLNAEGNMQKQA